MPADIRNFFRAFTVPKNRISEEQTTIDKDVIVVATPSRQRRQAGRRDAGLERERRKPAPPSKMNRRSSPKSVSLLEPSLSSLKSAPSQSTSVGKRLDIATMDGAGDDDDLFHSSPTPSVQRRMRAVEVPSQTSRHPQDLLQTTGVTRPEASFSSISTVSSFPTNSQSFSRRVVRAGLRAVTNSDSDSADDSEDGLADLDTFIPRKKMRMTPPGRHDTPMIEGSDTNMPKTTQHRARLSNRSSIKRGRSTPRLPPSPPRTAYKHSLANMIKANEERERQEAKIAETEAAVAAAEKRREEQQAAVAHPLDSTALAEVIQDDSDEGQRILAAMARTEALQTQEKFLYFKEPIYKAEYDPFPMRSLPDTSWARILRDRYARIDACLTGFVADLGARGKLDAAVLSWFARQLVHESREELCEAYVDVIRASAPYLEGFDVASLWTMENFYHTAFEDPSERPSNETPLSMNSPEMSSQHEERVVCICGYDTDDGSTIVCDSCGTWQHVTCYYPPYGGCGSRDDSVHHCVDCPPRDIDVAGAQRRQIKRQKETSLSSVIPQVGKEKVRGLQNVALVLACCAPYAGVETVGRCLTAMSLASIDDNVKHDAALRHSLQNCVNTLCGSLHPDDIEGLCEFVRRELFTEDKLPLRIQCQIITSLPANSMHANVLRRKLALYLITKSQKSRSLASGDWFSSILKRLRAAPEYSINEKTDYALLQDLTAVLSIAIDVGFSDFAFLSEQPEKSFGPFSISTPTSVSERTFNGQVDAVVEQMKAIGGRIRDVGAAHLKRVEAKTALERLTLRLEYGVRTRLKPRKHVFGV